jgi:hypothetical protein
MKAYVYIFFFIEKIDLITHFLYIVYTTAETHNFQKKKLKNEKRCKNIRLPKSENNGRSTSTM